MIRLAGQLVDHQLVRPADRLVDHLGHLVVHPAGPPTWPPLKVETPGCPNASSPISCEGPPGAAVRPRENGLADPLAVGTAVHIEWLIHACLDIEVKVHADTLCECIVERDEPNPRWFTCKIL